MYKTNNRVRIMDYLQKCSDKAVSVPEITDHLAHAGNPVNKTTVYRYLDRLEEEGLVIRYTAEDGRHAAYQYVGESNTCDEHLHLKCLSCGQVSHLECGFMDEIAEHMQKDHGFQIECRNSVIYGYCARCRAKEKNN